MRPVVPRAPQGVTAFDVAEYMRAIQRQYGGVVHFRTDLPVRDVPGVAYVWRVVFTRKLGRGVEQVFERGESLQWPTHQAKTITALQYRLLQLLDIKLEAEEASAARAPRDRPAGT